MRLAEFILGNTESILAEWEAFARSLTPGAGMDKLALRDHAEDILHAMARDMISSQSVRQQSDKSKGHGDAGEDSVRLNGASQVHAADRVRSGFDLIQVVAEYRALRASVIGLWRESAPDADPSDLTEVTRFNESIDQSIAKAVSSYTKQVDHARELFLATLGHDLRGPLNAINLSAALLSQSGQLDPEHCRVASQISESAHMMSGMIHELLDFTRTRLGASMPVTLAAMDLQDLCREILEEFRAGYPTRKVDFHSSGEMTGEWDAARLRQVVSNLLANAIQHGDEGVGIDLSLRSQASDVVIAVRGGGPPIPRASLATLFDPLVQGESPDLQKQRRPGSIGLGLYIAREVVTAHGGTIDVASSAEAGTVFTVRLPRRRAAR